MVTPPRPPGRPPRALPAIVALLLLLLLPLLLMLLLLLAVVALGFTDAVDWGPDDLAAGAALLAAGAIVYVLAARVASRAVLHALTGILLVLAVALVWSRLASGLFD